MDQTWRVPDEAFDAHYEALISLLDEMIRLLRAEQETFFLDWFEKDRAGIVGGRTHSVQHLLAAYGGAGSINDVLFQDHGTQRKFERLRHEIHEHAYAMLAELDEGGYYVSKR